MQASLNKIISLFTPSRKIEKSISLFAVSRKIEIGIDYGKQCMFVSRVCCVGVDRDPNTDYISPHNKYPVRSLEIKLMRVNGNSSSMRVISYELIKFENINEAIPVWEKIYGIKIVLNLTEATLLDDDIKRINLAESKKLKRQFFIWFGMEFGCLVFTIPAAYVGVLVLQDHFFLSNLQSICIPPLSFLPIGISAAFFLLNVVIYCYFSYTGWRGELYHQAKEQKLAVDRLNKAIGIEPPQTKLGLKQTQTKKIISRSDSSGSSRSLLDDSEIKLESLDDPESDQVLTEPVIETSDINK